MTELVLGPSSETVLPTALPTALSRAIDRARVAARNIQIARQAASASASVGRDLSVGAQVIRWAIENRLPNPALRHQIDADEEAIVGHVLGWEAVGTFVEAVSEPQPLLTLDQLEHSIATGTCLPPPRRNS